MRKISLVLFLLLFSLGINAQTEWRVNEDFTKTFKVWAIGGDNQRFDGILKGVTKVGGYIIVNQKMYSTGGARIKITCAFDGNDDLQGGVEKMREYVIEDGHISKFDDIDDGYIWGIDNDSKPDSNISLYQKKDGSTFVYFDNLSEFIHSSKEL